MNQPLTPSDLDELERLLADSGVGTAQKLERAKSESQGLGLFVRSLVGMDREAARQAFARFIEGRTLSANQLEFIAMIVEHLTHEGAVPVERLYEPPYTGLHSSSVDGLFSSPDADQIVAILEQVRARAVA